MDHRNSLIQATSSKIVVPVFNVRLTLLVSIEVSARGPIMFSKFFHFATFWCCAQSLLLDVSMHARTRELDTTRRRGLQGTAASLSILAFTTGIPRRVHAVNTRSRTKDYNVQKSEDEWMATLTPRQYEILRNGGTERPYSSILETVDRAGIFYCAGCDTPLFESKAKFHSGTGWPSFATALRGVEVERINPLQANFVGAELRCATCGSHLGDVFNDGWIFQGTPAAESGKRFCIDGSALVFKPEDGSQAVVGDQSPGYPGRGGLS